MNNQKTIADLRGLLFETIEAVKDGKLDIDKAKCISDLSQVMVNTAKAEIDYVKASGGLGSGFLEAAKTTGTNALPPGISGITQHRLKG
jgi:hypothetical protein